MTKADLFKTYTEKRKILERRVTQAEEKMRELDKAARLFGLCGNSLVTARLIEPDDGHHKTESLPNYYPTFIQAALEVVNDAYPDKIITSEVLARVGAKLDRKFSYSAGSTSLTRLAERGLIRHVAKGAWQGKPK